MVMKEISHLTSAARKRQQGGVQAGFGNANYF
jgi:hypothetical protein